MAPFERPFFTAEAPASRHHYGSAMCIGTPSGGAFSLAEQGGRRERQSAVPPETVPGTPDG